ncbi:UNVERIFIED_ORG: hypothetical protein JN05_03811 [Zoogloea ramigera]
MDPEVNLAVEQSILRHLNLLRVKRIANARTIIQRVTKVKRYV